MNEIIFELDGSVYKLKKGKARIERSIYHGIITLYSKGHSEDRIAVISREGVDIFVHPTKMGCFFEKVAR